MEKKRKTGIILAIFLAVILICGVGIYNLLFNFGDISIDNIPTGDLIDQSYSPNGDRLVRIYLVNGGATVDWSIRGEVVISEEKKQYRKNIYWNYHENKATVKWIDNDTVSINGHVLNVVKDTYDWRM